MAYPTGYLVSPCCMAPGTRPSHPSMYPQNPNYDQHGLRRTAEPFITPSNDGGYPVMVGWRPDPNTGQPVPDAYRVNMFGNRVGSPHVPLSQQQAPEYIVSPHPPGFDRMPIWVGNDPFTRKPIYK